MPLSECFSDEEQQSPEYLAENFGAEELDSDTFPLTYKLFDDHQRKDAAILQKLKRAQYHTKSFRGGGTDRDLICYNGKIVVPGTLQKYVLNWYHTYLLHPGSTRTEETIKLATPTK